jgi:hypothetical protein
MPGQVKQRSGESMSNDSAIDSVAFSDAERMLPEGDTIHTFRGGGMMLIGADWSRVLDAMRAAPTIRPSGELARSMKHGLAIHSGGSWLFIETATLPNEVGIS